MGLFSKLFGKNKESKPSRNESFNYTEELMDEETFWNIMEISKERSNGDYKQQQIELENELLKLTPSDLILYSNRFKFLREQANTWGLWGAFCIIQDGYFEDMFFSFREGVIGQGKDFYYKTIQNPESLIEVDSETIEGMKMEGLGYVHVSVFEELTGRELLYPFQDSDEMIGDRWEEDSDDFKKLFPTLYAKYND